MNQKRANTERTSEPEKRALVAKVFTGIAAGLGMLAAVAGLTVDLPQAWPSWLMWLQFLGEVVPRPSRPVLLYGGIAITIGNLALFWRLQVEARKIRATSSLETGVTSNGNASVERESKNSPPSSASSPVGRSSNRGIFVGLDDSDPRKLRIFNETGRKVTVAGYVRSLRLWKEDTERFVDTEIERFRLFGPDVVWPTELAQERNVKQLLVGKGSGFHLNNGPASEYPDGKWEVCMELATGGEPAVHTLWFQWANRKAQAIPCPEVTRGESRPVSSSGG